MNRLKQQALEANLLLFKSNLVVLTWGNASAFDAEHGWVAIKPSGVPYDRLTAEEMVVVDLDGKVLSGAFKPSSDTPTHLELYRHFPGVGGVVHTHSRWATAWAQAGRDLPVYGTTHADYFYGAVPCSRQLTAEEIRGDYEAATGQVIVETFTRRQVLPSAVPAVLVAGHGAFTWGADALEAVHHAVVLEECAMMAAQTERLNPECCPLSQDLLDKHFFRKHGRGAYYGQG